MKHKVGILTFHNTLNYGAILQAYALSSYITSLGLDCIIIDYACENIEKRETPFSFIREKKAKKIIKGCLSLKYKISKKKSFERFMSDYLYISEIKYTRKNINNLDETIDTIIVGSDQVWNLKLTGQDLTYFGDFNRHICKIAYAASFGTEEISNEYRGVLKPLLDDFKSVSVREKSGINVVKTITNRGVQSVMDPVFLLKKEEWIKIEKKIDLPEKYVLVYFVHYNTKKSMQIAKSLAAHYGAEIVYINNTYKSYPGVVNIKTASPAQFLYMINHAQCIVTGSFHGMCFSMIFNKDLWVESTDDPSGIRLKNLAETLAIDNRETDCYASDEKPIDYDEVNALIEKQIIKSKKFLIDALDDGVAKTHENENTID